MLIPMLFTAHEANCPNCWRFNCYDFIDNFCEDAAQNVDSQYLHEE